jgi:UDP-N-acetylbacillosamine N-acetyltransferase
MNSIILIGAGAHAKSVSDALLEINPAIKIIYVDSNAKGGEKLYGFNVVNSIPDGLEKTPIFVAIGDNTIRKKIFDKIGSHPKANIISNKAYVSKRSKLASGIFVGNFSHIGTEVEIGDNVIINNGAIVEHEVKIGKHSHICPGATVAGRVVIGEKVFVGVGSSVVNNVSICSNVIIGASSTVVDNITEPGTYVGVPARKIK